MQTRPISRRGLRPAVVSRLAALPLLAALLALGAAPARAATTWDISSDVTGPITVNSDVTLNIYAPGSVSASGLAIDVAGGTVNIYGGSVTGNPLAPGVPATAIQVDSGTVNVYGGSIFGYSYGIQNLSGTVNIYGCGLQLDNGFLTGTLKDGMSTISTRTSGPINLISTCVSYSISPLYDPSRSVKRGAAYPIKIQVLNASGENLSSAGLAVTALSILQKDGMPDGDLLDTGYANPDYGFRYDASLGGYIYNVDTRYLLSSGTYVVQFTVGSSSQLFEATFNVK
jgi:hypothetical protein